MKNFIKVVSILLIFCLVTVNISGCYGKFSLTKKLYTWNGTVGDKWVNSIVMWVLFIVPVYEVVGFVDLVILNVIEHWTGKNPVAMGPGESETQIVQMDGKTYEITASMNRFDINVISDEEITRTISLVYDSAAKSWYAQNEEIGNIKLAELDEDNLNILHLIEPNGEIVNVDLESNNIILE
jgi:hypothetical protein